MSKKIEEPIDINEIDKQIEQVEEITNPASDKPFDVAIEEARAALYENYAKSRKISNIVMLITVVLIIACFIMISQNNVGLRVAGYISAGAVVVGMIVYYILTKNKFPNETKKYIKFVTSTFNSYNYSLTEYSDVRCDHDEKIELAEILADKIYKNPNQVSSRNVVHGKYLNHTFKASDAAAYSGSGKSRKTNFVGKYIVIGNDLHFEGRFILINKLNENPVDLPDDLDDLVKLNEDELFEIYGPEGSDYNAVLGKSFVDSIRNTTPNDVLLNLVVVVWSGHTAIYASYSDSVIALPFEKEFNGQPMEQFKEQQAKLLSAACKLFGK